MLMFWLITFTLSYLAAQGKAQIPSSHLNRVTRNIDLFKALGLGGNRRTLGFIPGSGIGFKWLLSCPVTTITKLKTSLDFSHDVPMRFALLYPEIGDKQLKPINRMGLAAEDIYVDEDSKYQLETLGYGNVRSSRELSWGPDSNDITEAQQQEIIFDNAVKRDRLRSRIERMFFYKDFEALLAKMGIPAKPCLKRTICEIGADPFDGTLFGDLINILLSPSLGGPPEYEDENQEFSEYIEAEEYGKRSGNCTTKFPDCSNSVFSLIHDISEDLFS